MKQFIIGFIIGVVATIGSLILFAIRSGLFDYVPDDGNGDIEELDASAEDLSGHFEPTEEVDGVEDID